MCPGRPAAAAEDLCDAGAEEIGRGEEGDGVEVALDGDGVAQGAPGPIERGAPVEAEDVGAGLRMAGRSDAVSTPK